MVQVVFLDTNVILDYLEYRNNKIRDIVANLLHYHEKGRVLVATSSFNVSEVIDKLFQIYLIGDLMNERLSYDEIYKKKADNRKLGESVKEHKDNIESKLKDFMDRNNIEVLHLPIEGFNGYEDLYELISEQLFTSQDAMVVATALNNEVTYFLSNDNHVVKGIQNYLYAYNLKNEDERKRFKNDVLMSLGAN